MMIPPLARTIALACAAMLGAGHGPVEREAPRVHGGTTTWPAGAPLRLTRVVNLHTSDTLRIEAGARIETALGSGIRVGRGGVLLVEGTAEQPVVFECAGQRWTGCWEGLTIYGMAPIDHGSAGSPDGGCNQAVEDGRVYGGCDVRSNSGTIRFAAIRNARRGLRLLGVGSGTTIDHVAVVGSREDGVTLRGGTVDVRHLYVVRARSAGIRYDGGWNGRAQYVLVAQDSAHAAGVTGSGSPAGAATSADIVPRLWNVTVWNPAGADTTPALRLERGATGELRSWLLLQSPTALDVDDEETCRTLREGTLSLSGFVVASSGTPGATDADPPGCIPGAGAGDAEDALLRTGGARVLSDSAHIVAPWPAPLTPFGDFRPRHDTVLLPDPAPASADAFLEATNFAGALAPDSNAPPWYAQWSTHEGARIVPRAESPARGLPSGLPATTNAPTAAVLPNEPEGATIAVNATFDEDKQLGREAGGQWAFSEAWNGNNVAVRDGVLRFTYPRGFVGGSAPGIASVDGARLNFSTYYIAIRARWSVPWTDHASGVNKIVYWGELSAARSGRATGQFILNRRGRYIDVGVQWGQGYPGMCKPNDTARILPDCSVTRMASTPVDDGEWHVIELVMDASTGGQPNGRVRLWVDGVLQFDARNVRAAESGDARLHGVALAPVWGGVEGTKPGEEWLELDWVRVSGR